MKPKFILVFASLILSLSFFSSVSFSTVSTKQITEISSKSYELRYVRVFENGQWWMYVYGGPGGTVLIDRYTIDE